MHLAVNLVSIRGEVALVPTKLNVGLKERAV